MPGRFTRLEQFPVFEIDGASFDFMIDFAQIFSNYAQAEQLYSAQKIHCQYNGCPSWHGMACDFLEHNITAHGKGKQNSAKAQKGNNS